MNRVAKGLWNVVLSGYPNSGKTVLARRLVAEYHGFARVNVDELRQMLFNEAPPCRDEYIIYSLIAAMRDALLERGYSVVIDSTAPDNVTREFLMTTPDERTNELLVVLNVEREILIKRSIERWGEANLVFAWDKRWEEPKKKCCLFKFRSNNMEEFESSYALLTELLESETHPFKSEFRPSPPPLRQIQRALRKFLRVR
jgi:predicted kinase